MLLACNDQGFVPTASHNGDALPAIQVDPSFIDFGLVGQDDEPVVQTFTVSSVGGADLSVSGIELLGEGGAFTIVSEQTAFTLPPGTSQDIDVAYLASAAYDQMGQALVASNDPANPEALVELTGAGAVPELAIEPDPVDFGTGYIGCTQDSDLYLTNVGTDDLVIHSLSLQDDSAHVFDQTNDITFPLTLAPGQTQQVRVDFTPTSETSYRSRLVVSSNEPLGEREDEILGAGDYGGEYTDTWNIPTEPPSDIMFLVDQSGSMDDDQRRLGDNFSTFISSLNTYTRDWQIMVVNDDNGCNNSGILTSSSSNYQSTFSGAVGRGGGIYTESLLTPAANAVDKTDPTECNAGFMRADAMLHIIMVSDEHEQSRESSSTLVSRIIAKKGSSTNVRMSAIAGPIDGSGGCAEPATGYADAVSETGGVFLNICNDWATAANLELLAEASVHQDSFELTRNPVISTIAVRVNGLARNTGWTYDSAANAVEFSSNIPTSGDSVDITYSGNATCD